MNPDCTGTYAVQISPGGFTAHAFFVIDDGGNELQIIVTDPGTVISCIARRLFPKQKSRIGMTRENDGLERRNADVYRLCNRLYRGREVRLE